MLSRVYQTLTNVFTTPPIPSQPVSNQTDDLDQLPKEIVNHTLSYLDIPSLDTLRLTSKKNRVRVDDSLHTIACLDTTGEVVAIKPMRYADIRAALKMHALTQQHTQEKINKTKPAKLTACMVDYPNCSLFAVSFGSLVIALMPLPLLSLTAFGALLNSQACMYLFMAGETVLPAGCLVGGLFGLRKLATTVTASRAEVTKLEQELSAPPAIRMNH